MKAKKEKNYNLRTELDSQKGRPLIHLPKATLKEGDIVSQFMRLYGTPLDKDYEFVINGKDFYNPEKDAKNIGILSIPKGSLLYEKRGKVLKIDSTHFNKKWEHIPSIENKTLATILSYNGESGSPVFVMRSDDEYHFAGIITFGYQLKHMINTPEHPMGRTGMAQTTILFANRNPIKKLITSYLNNRK